ncbi:hypothetical protein RCCWILLIS_70 [Rhodobacter phage RcCWillis]|nr:hypothetical protein RCCWILLIS_70 [Rhodobacter phage RcCWillis]
MNTIIVYGPQASGKTVNKQALLDFYGCAAVVDDWAAGDAVLFEHLHLTNEPRERIGVSFCRQPYGKNFDQPVQIVSIEDALKAISEKIVCVQRGTTTWQGPASQAPGAQIDRVDTNGFRAPLTEAQIERLTFLIEECSEVIQEATKIIRFGFESFHPDDPKRLANRHRLMREMADLRAAYDMLTDAGDAHPVNLALIEVSRGRKLARSRYQESA